LLRIFSHKDVRKLRLKAINEKKNIMKKKNLILALSLTTLMSTSGWCAGEVLSESEKVSRQVTFAEKLRPGLRDVSVEDHVKHIHCLYFEAWCTTALRSGASTVQSDYGERVVANLIPILNHYASDLIYQNNFRDAFRLPVMFDRIAVRKSHADVSEFVDLAIVRLKSHIANQTNEYFHRLLNTDEFSTCLNLISTYRDVFSVIDRPNAEDITRNAASCLNQIRERATAKIELHGQKSRALEAYPELVATEIEQATRLINSFPEDHELRTYLQERFDSFLTSPFPPAADESQRTILRRMTDRLFG